MNICNRLVHVGVLVIRPGTVEKGQFVNSLNLRLDKELEVHSRDKLSKFLLHTAAVMDYLNILDEMDVAVDRHTNLSNIPNPSFGPASKGETT